MASAAGSLFARIYAGHTGVDPYTTAVSDTYQDLFGEGIFTGKGLYDVDAFTAALDGPRARERAALARPLRGPLRAHRARHRRRGRGRLPVERARPRAAPAPLGARRLADPALAVPVRAHALRASSATACRSSRAGRSSTTCGAAWCRPATVALLLCWPGRSCPGSPRRWTAARPGRRSPSRSTRCCWQPLRRAAAAAAVARVPARRRGRTLKTALAQVALQLTFLAYQACEMVARHRRSPSSAWPSPSAGCSSGRPRRPARPRGGRRGAGGARASCVEMAASPRIALAGARRWSRRLRPAALAGGAARPRCCGPPRRSSPTR